MADPCLTSAIELVDEARDMPTAEAAQYVFDRYTGPVTRQPLRAAAVANSIT